MRLNCNIVFDRFRLADGWRVEIMILLFDVVITQMVGVKRDAGLFEDWIQGNKQRVWLGEVRC